MHWIGETIPIRLFLSGFELTPTYRDVNKKFSTRYYLNLVLVDEENRRYFKQQEITIYRIQDDSDEYVLFDFVVLLCSLTLMQSKGMGNLLGMHPQRV